MLTIDICHTIEYDIYLNNFKMNQSFQTDFFPRISIPQGVSALLLIQTKKRIWKTQNFPLARNVSVRTALINITHIL